MFKHEFQVSELLDQFIAVCYKSVTCGYTFAKLTITDYFVSSLMVCDDREALMWKSSAPKAANLWQDGG